MTATERTIWIVSCRVSVRINPRKKIDSAMPPESARRVADGSIDNAWCCPGVA